MIAPYSARDLHRALDLIDRIDASGGSREVTALALHLDSWLAFDAAIELPSGTCHPEPGHRLYENDSETTWLLPGGRVLRVPSATAASSEPVAPIAVGDAPLDLARAADSLRAAAIEEFLGGVDLGAVPPSMVPTVITELGGVVPSLGRASRARVLATIADHMRPGDGWDRAHGRCLAAFERSLTDHATEVAGQAARGLVRLAAGLGPRPPVGDPARGVSVPFAVPRTPVRVAALRALGELPRDALQRLATVVMPHVRTALVAADAEERREAARAERLLSGDAEVVALAAELESGDPLRSAAAIARASGLPATSLEALLPLLIDALGDEDAAVRAAAWAVLSAAIEREEALLPRRVVLGLLESTVEAQVLRGIEMLRDRPEILDATVTGVLRDLLGGTMPAARVGAAERLAERLAGAPLDEAEAAYERLLRHTDPEVRRVAVRLIARDASARGRLAEAMYHVLLAHLHDDHPEIRVETALSVVEIGYPHAAEIVARLACDPHPIVRENLASVLQRADAPVERDAAARMVAHVDTLFDLASGGRNEDRLHWTAALDAVAASDNALVPQLLAALLTQIPHDTSDSFLAVAIQQIDERLLQLTDGGEALVSLCRHLVAPPHRASEHAARLAGAAASEHPEAFDFAWTLWRAGAVRPSAAALRALEAAAERPLSADVRALVRDLLADTDSEDERAVLRLMLDAPSAGAA